MTPQLNPYSAPRSHLEAVPQPLQIVPAGRWLRFFTYWIDYVVCTFLGAMAGALLALTTDDLQLGTLDSLLIGVALMVVYYASLEGLSGRTVGKLLLGTKIVDESGHPPRFGQILGRTFARLIPFEALAVFGSDRRALHDSLTGTYVVRAR